MSITPPSLRTAKAQARKLRAVSAAKGREISHSQALEAVARHHGHRDWNTLRAGLPDTPEPKTYRTGQRVRGAYLGHTVEGVILGAELLGMSEHCRITLRFDTAVDVIAFAGMSNLRRQVSAVVGPDGTSAERTSDGTPHLQIFPSNTAAA